MRRGWVELAAGGLTNRQIVEQLVLSETTVAKHVLNGMHKLGVRTRTSLKQARLDVGS